MKRLASLLMAILLLAATAACGTDNTKKNGAESTPASTENTSAGDAAHTAGKAEETFSIFIDHPWFWFDQWGNDSVSQEITKQTGVRFDVVRASDDQQLALLIAADDLPDFVYTSTTSMIALLSDPEVCYSYNELVDTYGVDIHATENDIQNNTYTDGNYYSILNAYLSAEKIEEGMEKGELLAGGGTLALAYRTDIYEAIGSPKLETIEDVENALKAAKEKFPNVIPLLPRGAGYTWYFAEQLGLQGGSKVGYDKNGDPCYFLNEEGIDQYFKLLNRFAREGLLTPESMTYNFDKFTEVRNSGNSFMQIGSSDEAQSSNNAAIEAGTAYRWKLLTNELSEDALVSVNTSIGWSGTFITKQNKNPERAIEFMSWARSEEGRKLCSWGIQGEHWDYDENGDTVTTKQYQDALSAGKQKQDDFGIAVWIFGDQGDENAFIDHAVTDPDAQDYITRLQSAVKHTKVMSELYFCIPTQGDALNIFNSLQDMYNSEVLKVIFSEDEQTCTRAIEAMYNQAEALGLSKLNSWMKDSLETRQAK